MSINFEKILLLMLHSVIVFGYPMITLYCMSQFYTNDRIENIKKKKTNYFVKTMVVMWVIILAVNDVFEKSWRYLFNIFDSETEASEFINFALCVFLMEIILFLVIMSVNHDKVNIYKYASARKIFLIAQLSSSIAWIILLLIRYLNIYKIEKNTMIICILINLILLTGFIISSSFNLSISKSLNWICVNQLFVQKLITSDEEHFKVKKCENSYIIYNGLREIKIFRINKSELNRIESLLEVER